MRLAVFHVVPQRQVTAIHMPLRLGAAILSRMRSPVTSRSNWANDNSTFRVRRPIDVVVLKLLGDRHEGGALPIKGLNDAGEIRQGSRQPVNLVDQDHVDQSPAQVGQQPLQGGGRSRVPPEKPPSS